jgi:hypothetical protein
MNATYQDIRDKLNDHCLDCSQCRSPTKGLCDEADRLLDDLLNASRSREDDQ